MIDRHIKLLNPRVGNFTDFSFINYIYFYLLNQMVYSLITTEDKIIVHN